MAAPAPTVFPSLEHCIDPGVTSLRFADVTIALHGYATSRDIIASRCQKNGQRYETSFFACSGRSVMFLNDSTFNSLHRLRRKSRRKPSRRPCGAVARSAVTHICRKRA